MDSGFTLIEMLVTVAIIAILAGIAVPSYLRYVDRARCAEVVAPVHSVMVALVGDFAENGVSLNKDFSDSMPNINGVSYGLPNNVEMSFSRKAQGYQVTGKRGDAQCDGDSYVLNENDSSGQWL